MVNLFLITANNFLPIVCKDHLSSIIPSDHQCTISACQEALVSVLEFEKFGTQHSPCVQAVCLSSNPFLGWGLLGSLSVVETWLLDRPKKFSYSHHGFLVDLLTDLTARRCAWVVAYWHCSDMYNQS